MSIIMPFVSAYRKPDYVGINEGDTYIWQTEFHSGPLQQYYEDGGIPKSQAEDYAEGADNDIEGWKIVILNFNPGKNEPYEKGRIQFLPYFYNLYKTKDWNAKEWKREEHNGKDFIYKYSLNVYKDYYRSSDFLADPHTNWNEFARDQQKDLRDAYGTNKADTSTENRLFFFIPEECGYSLEYTPTPINGTFKFEKLSSITRYTRNGVLLYYASKYDGDIIEAIKLEWNYLHENWWWILLLIIGIGIISISITITLLLKKKKKT